MNSSRDTVFGRASTFACACLLLVASTAAGQTPPRDSLAGVLADFTNRIAIAIPGAGPSAAETVNVFRKLAALEVATAPFGNSTGGFTVTGSGLQRMRSSQSFGPSFASRALTGGKGKLSVGLNWLRSNYGSFAGQDLSNGDFHPGRNGTAAIGYGSVKVNFSSNTVVGQATYGLTDNVDLGIAVPWVQIGLDIDQGFYSPTGQDLTAGNHFIVPHTAAAGIGDIVLLSKYQFWRRDETGLAAEMHIRLPSGDTNDLRGAGVARTLFQIVGSRGGKFAPHVNLGYEIWSDRVSLSDSVFVKNRLSYAAGMEIQPHALLTLVVDVIGHRLFNGGQTAYQTVDFGPGVGAVDFILATPKALNVVSVVPGTKWNALPNVLVTGNVLLSVSNNGLRAKVTPVLGFDWAF